MSSSNQAGSGDPHDESYDSIDRTTGTLTPGAVRRRAEIIAWATAREAAPTSWPDALEAYLEAGAPDLADEARPTVGAAVEAADTTRTAEPAEPAERSMFA